MKTKTEIVKKVKIQMAGLMSQHVLNCNKPIQGYMCVKSKLEEIRG